MPSPRHSSSSTTLTLNHGFTHTIVLSFNPKQLLFKSTHTQQMPLCTRSHTQPPSNTTTHTICKLNYSHAQTNTPLTARARRPCPWLMPTCCPRFHQWPLSISPPCPCPPSPFTPGLRPPDPCSTPGPYPLVVSSHSLLAHANLTSGPCTPAYPPQEKRSK